MKMRALLFSFVFIAAALCVRADVVVTSPPVGYDKLALRAASDSSLGLTLVKRPVLTARVSAVDASTVTVAGDSLIQGAYAPTASTTYYLQFITGKLAGLCYPIQTNTATVISLDTNSDDLTQHPLGAVVVGKSGDLVRVRAYWQIADVFGAGPASLKVNPVAVLPTGPYVGGDAILLPDVSSPGTNKLPATTLYFVTGTGWRAHGDAASDFASTPLPPGRPFTVRRQGTAAEVLIFGDAAIDPLRIKIPAVPADSDFDFGVAFYRSGEISLSTSGLLASLQADGALNATTDDSGDSLLEFDATREGMALAAAHRFRAQGVNWFEGGKPADPHSLKSNTGYILRLRGERSARYWLQPSAI